MTAQLTRRTLLASAGLALAGCAAVPTSGQVEQVSPASPSQSPRGVDVRPAPPTVDAPPDVIVAGFIDAMASLEDGHTVARTYLTEQAARVWQPDRAGVTVFDGDTRTTVTTGEHVTLQASLVGTLDDDDHYDAAQAGRTATHTFAMARVSGQWRIATPPKGLLVSQYTLQHRFSPVTVWFRGRSGLLVPERQWLATTELTPARAVAALLDGPSAWLAPAVTSAIPAGATLAAGSVAVEKGLATVVLDHVAALPDDQRVQAVQQIAMTLRPFDEVTSVRVVSDGQPWTLPGREPADVAAVDSLGELDPVPTTASGDVAVVVGRAVGRMDQAGTFTPLDGSLGTSPWAGGVSALAMGHDVVAAVDARRTQLVTRHLASGALVSRLTATGLLRPQVSREGDVWAATGADAATALHHGSGNQPLSPVALPGLSGARILAFSLSPDEARLALVVERSGRTELGLVHLDGVTAGGYRVLPLVAAQDQVNQIVDVGWATPAELMVLAATTAQGRPGVWQVSVDGAEVLSVGPSGDEDVTSLVTLPQRDPAAARILVGGHQVQRYDEAWRWSGIGSRVAAMGPLAPA